jgi:hypothetical protein
MWNGEKNNNRLYRPMFELFLIEMVNLLLFTILDKRLLSCEGHELDDEHELPRVSGCGRKTLAIGGGTCKLLPAT